MPLLVNAYPDHVDYRKSLAPADLADHKTYDSKNEWITRYFDQEEHMNDNTEYDDYNGFFRISLGASDPIKYLDGFSDNEFQASHWFPKNFFRRAYFRNMFTVVKNFIADLKDLDFTGVPNSKALKGHLTKATSLLKKAFKQYDTNQTLALYNLVEAIKEGQSVLERLRYYQIGGRLK